MTPVLSLLLGLVSLALPAAAIAWLALTQADDRWEAVQRVALATGVVALFAVAAPWSYTSQWLRPVMVVALVAAAARHIATHRDKPSRCPRFHFGLFALGVGSWSLSAAAIAGILGPEPSASLRF